MWPPLTGSYANGPGQWGVKIYCVGQLKEPGQLTFDSGDRISLLSAISKAGGMTDRASNTVKIKRRGPDGKDTEITVKYSAVLKGKVPDPELKPDDVIVVDEAFF